MKVDHRFRYIEKQKLKSRLSPTNSPIRENHGVARIFCAEKGGFMGDIIQAPGRRPPSVTHWQMASFFHMISCTVALLFQGSEFGKHASLLAWRQRTPCQCGPLASCLCLCLWQLHGGHSFALQPHVSIFSKRSESETRLPDCYLLVCRCHLLVGMLFNDCKLQLPPLRNRAHKRTYSTVMMGGLSKFIDAEWCTPARHPVSPQ